MYVWEIVEGRGFPIPIGRAKLETIPNTKVIGLVLRLTGVKWRTGKAVIMYSSFCVLKVILEIRKKGVYRSTFIKMRLYWYRGVHGDVFNY